MSNYDTTKDSRMVTGLFRDRDSAERAYTSLADRGYNKDDVTLMMSDDTRKTHFADTDTELGSKAAEGAGVGAGIGGTIGAVLAGIAAVGTTLVLPGIGLVVAGPIAAALAGAGAGGLAGGLVGALIGAGIPEERVVHYEEGIKNGGILMGVTPRSAEDAAHIERSWTDSAGEHIIGTGVGATGGAVTGAAIGSVAGPIGTVAGAAIGGIAGGLAGKGAAEVVNPKTGDDLSQHHFAKGVGAGSGAAMGAAAGAVAGPVGMAAGAAIGGIAGGMAGRGAAEVANPKSDDNLSGHHLSTGVGAGGGAAAGAAIGAVGGPIGMAAGAAIGALAGGAAGQAAGGLVNPAEENAYWRNSYQSAPYYSPQYTYDDYGPAYQLGYNSRGKYIGQSFDSAENDLSNEWNSVRGTSRLSWNEAKSATRA
ncbi:MAG TPA: hypothetical protein VFS02_09710, partial [Telluria sp.]|nr:hypothetical protein [Telluria sp.]